MERKESVRDVEIIGGMSAIDCLFFIIAQKEVACQVFLHGWIAVLHGMGGSFSYLDMCLPL